MIRTIRIASFIFIIAFASLAHAKPPTNIGQTVMTNFQPAVENKTLETAHYDLKMDALRSFVVLKRGGIPAERARYFIEWQEYDYRGSLINLEKDGKLTTRRGKPYTYLRRGDVLAVAGVKYFNDAVYLKLITPEIYAPEGMEGEKHFSRVTVDLGIKFPKSVFKADDAEALMAGMKEWMEPFSDLDAAKAYGAELRKTTVAEEIAEEEPEVKADVKTRGDAIVKAKSGTEPVYQKRVDSDTKMEILEDKIEAARKQMEDAEKEMQELKKDMKK